MVDSVRTAQTRINRTSHTTSMIRWDQGTLAEMLPILDRIRRDFPGVRGFRPSVAMADLAAGNVDDARAVLAEARKLAASVSAAVAQPSK